MAQYDSGAYTTYLSKAEEATLLQEQEAFAQEDTLAGRIYHYMDPVSYTHLDVYKRQRHRSAWQLRVPPWGHPQRSALHCPHPHSAGQEGHVALSGSGS